MGPFCAEERDDALGGGEERRRKRIGRNLCYMPDNGDFRADSKARPCMSNEGSPIATFGEMLAALKPPTTFSKTLKDAESTLIQL